MNAQVEKVYEQVVAHNRGDLKFHQAVREVLNSLVPVIEKQPQYAGNGLLERLVESERQIILRVPQIDDAGNVQVNHDFRIEFNSALGPYKGSLCFRPSVNIGIIKFLGFEQIFRNALTGQGIGGAKGGSNFDPHGKSDAEVMRFYQSFMTELSWHIDPNTDVPADDIDVGDHKTGYLFGQYRRLHNRYDAGVLTGKGLGFNGSLARTGATDYGTVLFAQSMLGTEGDSLEGKAVAVSSSGNIAVYAVERLQALGGRAVTASDSSGYVVDEVGIDLDLLKQVREIERGHVADYVVRRPGAKLVADGSVWDAPVDITLPCTTQNEPDSKGAATLLKNGCMAVSGGANISSTPKTIKALQTAGILYGPAKTVNADGMTISALETERNAGRTRWDSTIAEKRLAGIMEDIRSACVEMAEFHDKPGDYVLGANVAGFTRVAGVMITHGIV